MIDLWQARAGQTVRAAALFYTFYFAVTAIQLFNMTAWLGDRGIDAPTAGRLQGSADLFFVGGVLLGGLLADWKGFNPRLFLSYFAVALCGYILLGLSSQAWSFGIALALISFAFLPITNLADTHVQPYVSRDLFPYARVRALGSASFALIIIVSAFLSEAAILRLFYPGILVFVLLMGLSLLILPSQPVHVPAPFTQRLKTFAELLGQPRFLLFYLIVALIFGSHGAYYIYAVPIWREWGFGSEKIYVIIAWGVVVEVVFFLVAPKALTERRAVPLLALCALAAVVRWIAWPFVTGWVELLAVHFLHVFTFALTHLTSLAFLRRRVPEAQLGAAQALMPAIALGGMAISKLIAAQFITSGAQPTFFAMAIFAALAFPPLLILRGKLGQRSIPA